MGKIFPKMAQIVFNFHEDSHRSPSHAHSHDDETSSSADSSGHGDGHDPSQVKHRAIFEALHSVTKYPFFVYEDISPERYDGELCLIKLHPALVTMVNNYRFFDSAALSEKKYKLAMIRNRNIIIGCIAEYFSHVAYEDHEEIGKEIAEKLYDTSYTVKDRESKEHAATINYCRRVSDMLSSPELYTVPRLREFLNECSMFHGIIVTAERSGSHLEEYNVHINSISKGLIPVLKHVSMESYIVSRTDEDLDVRRNAARAKKFSAPCDIITEHGTEEEVIDDLLSKTIGFKNLPRGKFCRIFNNRQQQIMYLIQGEPRAYFITDASRSRYEREHIMYAVAAFKLGRCGIVPKSDTLDPKFANDYCIECIISDPYNNVESITSDSYRVDANRREKSFYTDKGPQIVIFAYTKTDHNSSMTPFIELGFETNPTRVSVVRYPRKNIYLYMDNDTSLSKVFLVGRERNGEIYGNYMIKDGFLTRITNLVTGGFRDIAQFFWEFSQNESQLFHLYGEETPYTIRVADYVENAKDLTQPALFRALIDKYAAEMKFHHHTSANLLKYFVENIFINIVNPKFLRTSQNVDTVREIKNNALFMLDDIMSNFTAHMGDYALTVDPTVETGRKVEEEHSTMWILNLQMKYVRDLIEKYRRSNRRKTFDRKSRRQDEEYVNVPYPKPYDSKVELDKYKYDDDTGKDVLIGHGHLTLVRHDMLYGDCFIEVNVEDTEKRFLSNVVIYEKENSTIFKRIGVGYIVKKLNYTKLTNFFSRMVDIVIAQQEGRPANLDIELTDIGEEIKSPFNEIVATRMINNLASSTDTGSLSLWSIQSKKKVRFDDNCQYKFREMLVSIIDQVKQSATYRYSKEMVNLMKLRGIRHLGVDDLNKPLDEVTEAMDNSLLLNMDSEMKKYWPTGKIATYEIRPEDLVEKRRNQSNFISEFIADAGKTYDAKEVKTYESLRSIVTHGNSHKRNPWYETKKSAITVEKIITEPEDITYVDISPKYMYLFMMNLMPKVAEITVDYLVKKEQVDHQSVADQDKLKDVYICDVCEYVESAVVVVATKKNITGLTNLEMLIHGLSRSRMKRTVSKK